MNKIKVLSFIVFILLTLSACISTAEPTPTNSQLIIPTITPTLEVTKQPSPTPQRFSTPTPRIPQPSPTAIPVIDVNSVEILRSAILTFEKDGNIWVVDHGEFRQLTDSGKDSDPKLTQDGKYVMFIRSRWDEYKSGDDSEEFCLSVGLSDLMRIGLDGASEKILVTGSQLATFRKDFDDNIEYWSFCGMGIDEYYIQPGKDPQIVVFSSGSDSRQGFNEDLYVLDLNTSEIRVLERQYEGGRFVISPDWNWVASASQTDLDIFSLRSQFVYRNVLSYQLTHEGPPYISYPTIRWYPNSRGLMVVTEEGELFNPFDFQNAIWDINLEELKPIKVNQFQVSSFNTSFMSGVISPDLKKVIYSCPTENPEELQICIRDLQNEEIFTFSPLINHLRKLIWSPDSQTILLGEEILFLNHGEESTISSWSPGEIDGNRAHWLNDHELLLTYYEVSGYRTFYINLLSKETFEIEGLLSVFDFLLNQ